MIERYKRSSLTNLQIKAKKIINEIIRIVIRKYCEIIMIRLDLERK